METDLHLIKYITEEIILPGEPGKDFTYDDFTPEQIAELKRPATEAAKVAIASAQSAQQAATEAQEAVKNANTVIGKTETAINNANTAAETANLAVESVNKLETRVEQAEDTRVQSETQRQTAETNRASSEQRREANETQRQEKFAQIESDASALKNSLNEAEQQRVEAESARKTAESQRVAAEQQRVTEFSEIKNEAETLITKTTEAKNAATEAATSATNAAEEANTAAQSANDAAEKANQAAQNVDGRLTSLEEKASQTYDNLAAIEASGETNPNKIYIDGNTLISYVYKGGKFEPFSGGDGSNKILDWDTDVATTRKQVPSAERKVGLQISYKLNNTNWINEQFIGLNASVEAYWIQDAYWQTIALKKDVDTVDTKLKTFFGRILEWNTDESTTKKQIPKSERVNGLIVAFNNPSKGWVIQQFIGSTNVEDNFWGNTSSLYWKTLATATDISESELKAKKLFGRILEWNTNQANTLNGIPVNERVLGLVVTFKDPTNGWKRLQYISDSLETGALWGNQPANWKDLDAKEVDLSPIEDSLLELDNKKLDKDFGVNIANPSEFEIYGFTEQGTNFANGNYYKTGFIPVRDNLVMNYEHPSGVWSAVFGKDKTKVIRTFQSKQYTRQEGDYYVRFVFNQTNRNSLQVEEGTESTEYEPFTQTKSIDEKIQEVKDSVSDTYKYTDSLCNSLHDRLSDFEEKYVQKGNAVEGLSNEAKWYDHVTQSWKTGYNMYSTKYEANMAYFSTTQTGNPNGYFIVYLDENEKFLGGFLNGLEGEKPEIKRTYFLMAPVGCKYIVYQAQGTTTDNIFYKANIVGLDEIYKKIESYDVLYQRKAVAQTVNFGVPPKTKEELSILFIGNSFCGQMYQYLKELTTASGHTQIVFNSVARGGKTFKYWLDDLQYEDSYPEGYLDMDNPTDEGQYDTTFDRTDTLYKRLINPPKDNDGYGDPIPDRKWDIICVCGLPCQNLFDFNQDNPYTVQMVEKIRRVVQDRNIPIYLYVPPVPPSPNPALGEENVWGNTFETSDEAFVYANQILIDKMGNMGIPVNRLMFGSVGMQNLRKRVKINLTKTEGSVKYDSELTIDRLHPFYGLPYLVTSAICYQTILEEIFDNINAIEDMKGVRVSQNNPSDPTQIQYLNIGESNMKYAVDAVKGALLDSWNLNSYLEDNDIIVIDDIKTYNEQIIAENS